MSLSVIVATSGSLRLCKWSVSRSPSSAEKEVLFVVKYDKYSSHMLDQCFFQLEAGFNVLQRRTSSRFECLKTVECRLRKPDIEIQVSPECRNNGRPAGRGGTDL